MGTERAEKRAQGLTPHDATPLRPSDKIKSRGRYPIRPSEADPVPHGVTGVRFAAPVPTGQVRPQTLAVRKRKRTAARY